MSHSYFLNQFVKRSHLYLDNYKPDDAGKFIAYDLLPKYLVEEDFINTIPNIPGRHTLHDEQKYPDGYTILGHWHPEESNSFPHDHGEAWAIYSVVSGHTEMIEYEQIDDKRAVVTNAFVINPGEAAFFPIRGIHSHQTRGDSKLIRIERFNIWGPYPNTGKWYWPEFAPE